MDDDPKVFADGVITVALGMRGLRVYAGQHHLRHVRSMKVDCQENGVVRVELGFGAHPMSAGEVETEMRSAKALPWVIVK